MLLLPEFSDIAIRSIPINITRRACTNHVMPTIDKELIDDISGSKLSCNEVVLHRISVNRLTASWTHVYIPLLVVIHKFYIQL